MKKLVLIVIIGVFACSGKPGPKEVVFDFIRAVYESDSLKITEILDVDAYIKLQLAEMSPEDSSAVFDKQRISTIQSLLGDGEKRAYWMKSQLLVNRVNVKDDFAEVDVSFIDKVSSTLRYTKIQLRKQPDNSWRIVYFK